MQTPFSASVSPAEKRALFSAGETRAKKASTNKAREKALLFFSLWLQPRINIIVSKLESCEEENQ